MDVSDQLLMDATADVIKIVLPTFLAKILKRIPRFQLAQTDLVFLSTVVSIIKNRLAELASQISSNAFEIAFMPVWINSR